MAADTQMHRVERNSIPRPALAGGFALVALAVLLAFAAEPTHVPAVPEKVTASIDILFEDSPDGSVLVRTAEDGRKIAVLPSGTNGFARGLLRGLARERRQQGIGPDASFNVTKRADGQLVLRDAATGRTVVLDAFGQTNALVFSDILKQGGIGQ